MPTKAFGGVLRQRCYRKVSWSIRRGGCRFDHGHHGVCKPVSGRAR